MKKNELLKKIEASKTRSAWARGVRAYALELLEDKEGDDIPEDAHDLRSYLLSGAQTWKDYSWGGSSLIYDADICERLSNPTEKKITRNGERRPNNREEWLDVQARALFQAELLIRDLVRG